jgi:hypothetical protein
MDSPTSTGAQHRLHLRAFANPWFSVAGFVLVFSYFGFCSYVSALSGLSALRAVSLRNVRVRFPPSAVRLPLGSGRTETDEQRASGFRFISATFPHLFFEVVPRFRSGHQKPEAPFLWPHRAIHKKRFCTFRFHRMPAFLVRPFSTACRQPVSPAA